MATTEGTDLLKQEIRHLSEKLADRDQEQRRLSEVIDDLGGYVHSGGQTAGTIPSAWVFEPGHPKVRAQDLLPTAPTAPQKPTSPS